mmetsp:Transcript_106116/g.274478  ORF Transcript_106116/g.274478 Transcript_106116/m.274478 type:complete len:329 (+) Transcript_106116:413-1399(+)
MRAWLRPIPLGSCIVGDMQRVRRFQVQHLPHHLHRLALQFLYLGHREGHELCLQVHSGHPFGHPQDLRELPPVRWHSIRSHRVQGNAHLVFGSRSCQHITVAHGHHPWRVAEPLGRLVKLAVHVRVGRPRHVPGVHPLGPTPHAGRIGPQSHVHLRAQRALHGVHRPWSPCMHEEITRSLPPRHGGWQPESRPTKEFPRRFYVSVSTPGRHELWTRRRHHTSNTMACSCKLDQFEWGGAQQDRHALRELFHHHGFCSLSARHPHVGRGLRVCGFGCVSAKARPKRHLPFHGAYAVDHIQHNRAGRVWLRHTVDIVVRVVHGQWASFPG